MATMAQFVPAARKTGYSCTIERNLLQEDEQFGERPILIAYNYCILLFALSFFNFSPI